MTAHPYAGHPVSLVLADHQRLGFTRSATDPAVCDCGWRGALCDHPAHLAEVLHRAAHLADGPPPETPTARSPRREGRQEEPMSNDSLVILPDTYALPPEPPVGTVVRGRKFHYVRRDFDTPRCWAAGDGPAPVDLNSIPAWTWGEVLNDGPVTLVLAR